MINPDEGIPAFGVRYDCNIIRNSLEGVRRFLCSNHPKMALYSSLSISLMSKIVSKHVHATHLEDFTPSSRISGSGLATAASSRRVVKCRDSVFINLTSTSNTLLKRTQSTAGSRSEIDKQIRQGFASTYRHCPWSTSPSNRRQSPSKDR
jgi:hypothetical protein